MKKAMSKHKCFVAGMVLVLCMAGCSTMLPVGLVYNDAIPLEQSAQIYIANIGAVTAFNGIPVNWKSDIVGYKTVQIPAGDTLLEFDINSYGGYNTHYTGTAAFRYTFQPLKKYMFWIASREGMNVYAWGIEEKVSASWGDEKHFVEFVKFLGADNKTILE